MSSLAATVPPDDAPAPVLLAAWDEQVEQLRLVNEQAVTELLTRLPRPLKVIGVVGARGAGNAFIAKGLLRFPASPFATKRNRGRGAAAEAWPGSRDAAADRGIWISARQGEVGSLVVVQTRGMSQVNDAFNAKAFAVTVALCDTLVCSSLDHRDVTGIDDIAASVIQLKTLLAFDDVERYAGPGTTTTISAAEAASLFPRLQFLLRDFSRSGVDEGGRSLTLAELEDACFQTWLAAEPTTGGEAAAWTRNTARELIKVWFPRRGLCTLPCPSLESAVTDNMACATEQDVTEAFRNELSTLLGTWARQVAPRRVRGADLDGLGYLAWVRGVLGTLKDTGKIRVDCAASLALAALRNAAASGYGRTREAIPNALDRIGPLRISDSEVRPSVVARHHSVLAAAGVTPASETRGGVHAPSNREDEETADALAAVEAAELADALAAVEASEEAEAVRSVELAEAARRAADAASPPCPDVISASVTQDLTHASAAADDDEDGAARPTMVRGTESARPLPQRRAIQPVTDVRQSELSFQLSDALGSGATSTVYRTRWRGVECAAKIYHTRALRSRAAMRELATAPVLRHPSLVSVYARIVVDPPPPPPLSSSGSANPPLPLSSSSSSSSSAEPKVVGVLMELVEGGDLAEACAGHGTSEQHRASSWSLRAKLRVCKSVAVAAAFAHGCRVVHSDIKHENILLSRRTGEDGAPAEVKLTDFGSAKLLNTLGRTAMTGGLGSPAFMCPVFQATKKPSTESDVFSLGMVFWLVFHPVPDDDLLEVAEGLGQGTCPAIDPDRSKVPADVARLIERCWDPVPKERPSADSVVGELERLHGFACAAAPDTPVLRSSQSSWALFWDLVRHPDVGRALHGLPWRRPSPLLAVADAPDSSPFAAFVRGQMRDARDMNVTRIEAVQHSLAKNFLELHEWDGMSAVNNAALQHQAPPPQDSASIAAMNALEGFFADDAAAGPSRVLFAWHGGCAGTLEAICHDGVRPLRTTDAGYFGAGSYFAMEAAYAAQYATADADGAGVLLFAVSVTRVRAITVARDYHKQTLPKRKGFSDYYSGDTRTSIALAAGCDAHFVPVKDFGFNDPREPTVLLNNRVGFQACHDDEAQYHELVIQSHLRATPVAMVHFSR